MNDSREPSPIDKELLQAWRLEFHRWPETAFEEQNTSGRIARILREEKLNVITGLGGGTGVLAFLDGSLGPGRTIGLRADIDALDVTECNTFEHVSQNTGKMHACGHDGHTVMLLGAACSLARNPDFFGRVYFIFQPAEENEGGGKVMVDEGLFETYPMDAVYALHNWPGLPVGEAAIHDHAVMAAFDVFTVSFRGKGCHAAMPHMGTDVILAASYLVTQIQGIISREKPPNHSAVLSVTQFHAGEAFNVSPEIVELKGTLRCFDESLRMRLETRFRETVESIARLYDLEANFDYQSRYPATINDSAHASVCANILEKMPEITKIHRDLPPSMASEDFAFMLQEIPGAYIWLGNGEESESLHNPYYDFNDEVAPIGSAYWQALVKGLSDRPVD